MNENGKKYSSKIKISSKIIEELIPAMTSLELRQWKDIIEDYIEISRKRKNNKLAMFYLQKNLIESIHVCEGSIKLFIEILNEPEKAKNHTSEKFEVNDILIQHWKKELYINIILARAFKYIGDGILWRALKYDYALISALSYIDDPGPLKIDQGFINELYEFGNCIYDSEVKEFVFHGITNFGRIGDMTTISKDDKIEFVEIKSSDKQHGKRFKDRVDKQNERLKKLTEYANERKGFIEENKIIIIDIDEKPKTNLNKIKRVLYKSKERGFSGSKINELLDIIVINLLDSIDSNKSISFQTDFQKSLRENKKDIIRQFSSIDYLEFSKIKNPITIFPFASDIIADILVGKIIIEYYFNFTKLFNEITKDGWNVNESIFLKNKIDPKKDYFFQMTKNEITIDVPSKVINMLIFELYSLESILKIFNIYLSNPEYSGKNVMFRFMNEESIWK